MILLNNYPNCFFKNRVSRLVMACANRTEIVRKAILNCSTDMFDRSRSFVFHILSMKLI